MNNFACFSNCKNEKEKSNKLCICGGHNAGNPKRNKKHNSTANKLIIKQIRKWMKYL